MNLDIIKKICMVIIGIAIFVAFCFLFFYVVIFALIAGGIYFLYKKFIKPKTKKYKEEPKSKTINNVIIDAEYEEKN